MDHSRLVMHGYNRSIPWMAYDYRSDAAPYWSESMIGGDLHARVIAAKSEVARESWSL